MQLAYRHDERPGESYEALDGKKKDRPGESQEAKEGKKLLTSFSERILARSR